MYGFVDWFVALVVLDGQPNHFINVSTIDALLVSYFEPHQYWNELGVARYFCDENMRGTWPWFLYLRQQRVFRAGGFRGPVRASYAYKALPNAPLGTLEGPCHPNRISHEQ